MRVREDVFRDLHKAILQVQGFLDIPGTLEIALREKRRPEDSSGASKPKERYVNQVR